MKARVLILGLPGDSALIYTCIEMRAHESKKSRRVELILGYPLACSRMSITCEATFR